MLCIPFVHVCSEVGSLSLQAFSQLSSSPPMRKYLYQRAPCVSTLFLPWAVSSPQVWSNYLEAYSWPLSLQSPLLGIGWFSSSSFHQIKMLPSTLKVKESSDMSFLMGMFGCGIKNKRNSKMQSKLLLLIPCLLNLQKLDFVKRGVYF